MFNVLKSYSNRESVQLPLCEVDGTVGACMRQSECKRERGLFAGYCGSADGVCCVVDRTCDDYTKSHHTYFRNPSYPNNDTEARPCPFTIEIGRSVCAVRIIFEKFVLAKFEDGVCIRDTLTILGTKQGSTTPVCGNLTNWSTTFAVEERSKLVLAMVLQGDPAYTFSIGVTQLACDDIAVFRSPTFAGIRNEDAAEYTPTTTTKKPKTTVTDEEEATTTEGTVVEETTTKDDDDEDDDDNDDDDDDEEEDNIDVTDSTDSPVDDVPTTLTPGVIPKPVIREVQIDDLDDGVYLETQEATPAISAFKRAFDLKVDDRCWQYDRTPPSFRIIGGGHTGINEYPWQVALVYNRKFFCGGSLISDRHILTAAHCVFGSFSKGIDLLRVSLGDHDLTTKNETKNVVAKIKHIHWHLHYNPHTTSHDIALMELEEPVQFRYGVSAVKLPSDLDDMYEKQNATVTGWGRYSIKKKATNPVMKEYTGPLMLTSKCVTAWNKFPGISAKFPNHVCLDVTMGTPCHGDSGGPLVSCVGVHCTQIGVVSFGFPLCTNVGLPAVFTRVSHYKKWIDMNLTPLDFVSYH